MGGGRWQPLRSASGSGHRSSRPNTLISYSRVVIEPRLRLAASLNTFDVVASSSGSGLSVEQQEVCVCVCVRGPWQLLSDGHFQISLPPSLSPDASDGLAGKNLDLHLTQS